VRKRINILLVDDAVLITKRIAEIIEEVSCVEKVIVANNFDEAVAAINNNTFDLVLLDIHLPGKTGIDLLDYLSDKKIPANIAMVTNKVSQYYKDLCFEKGAKHFLDKSREFENIAPLVESYCSEN
jgi:response regulator of citrate/malate metabolism